jgi:hypothetical protein
LWFLLLLDVSTEVIGVCKQRTCGQNYPVCRYTTSFPIKSVADMFSHVKMAP